jgi:hypothetical protein
VVRLDSKQICQISEFTNLIRVVQLVCLGGKKTVLFELRWMRLCCFPCVCVRARKGVGGDGDHNGGCASSASSLMRCHVSGSVFELLPLHLFWSQGRARYVWPYPRTWRQVLPSSPLLLCSLYPSLSRDLSLSILSCVFLLCSCNGCVFKTFRKDLIRVFWLYFDSWTWWNVSWLHEGLRFASLYVMMMSVSSCRTSSAVQNGNADLCNDKDSRGLACHNSLVMEIGGQVLSM